MDGWPGATEQVRVGQPLNLTMTLQATGLPFEALPALSLPPIDGAKAYPDKPVTGTRQDGPWLVGRRQQAFAIVPGTCRYPDHSGHDAEVVERGDRPDGSGTDSRPGQLTVLPAVGAAHAQTAAPADSIQRG